MLSVMCDSAVQVASALRHFPARAVLLKHVALLIETSRTYGRELVSGIRRCVSEKLNWSISIELRDLESPPPAWLSNWRGDGVLTRTGSKLMARAVAKLGLPTVELRATKWDTAFPFVGINNKTVGQLAARHLMDRGLKSFAVYELDTETFFLERRNSFLSCLEEHGFPAERYLQRGHREKPANWERQQRRLGEWLSTLPKPVGILACTDQLGCWLLDACRHAGLRVPDDVAVIGVENDETLCTLSSPPLSSIRLGGERVGYAAAELLDHMMRRPRTRPRALLLEPAGLVVRQSSDVVAVDDPAIARVIRMIRDGACAGISVERILRDIPISRSTLERRFRQVLGRTPNAEIVRVRLRRARQLLRDTDLPLETIADRSGLTRAAYLSHVFRNAFHETPGQYRSRHRI